MYRKTFWFLLFWTLISLYLYLSGYDVLGPLMIVLAVDLIALGFVIEIGRRSSFKDVSAEINTRIENIEKVCQSILESCSEEPIMRKLEEKLSKQKDDVSYLLDKMSRKMLDLEERLNKFGYSLAEHLEEKKKEENSFQIGETLYLEDLDNEEKV